MSHPHPTRRDFALTLALASLSACLPHPGGSAPAAPAPPAPTSSTSPETREDAATADALLGAVQVRYGAVLPEAQRADVRGSIARNERLARRLRDVSLPNGADPFAAFGAAVRERR